MCVSNPLHAIEHVFQETHLTIFLCEMGCRVVQLETGLWHSTGSRIFQPLLMKGPIELSPSDRQTLWDGGSLFLRYPVSIEYCGIPSYIYLVDDKNYDLDSLPRKQRKEARRALRKCCVEQIDIGYIVKKGIDLVLDTYRRQGRTIDEWGINWWKRNFEICICHYLSLSENFKIFDE